MIPRPSLSLDAHPKQPVSLVEQMKSRPSLAVLLALLFTAVLCLSGCNESPEAEQAGPDATLAASEHMVEVVPAREHQVQPLFRSFGTISYSNKITISTTVEGTITSIPVETGESVARGDVLARLENIQLTIQQEQARTAVEEARAHLRLARSKQWEGELQVLRELISLEKLDLQLEQLQRELGERKKQLRAKRRLLELDGISEEEVTNLELSYEAARTEYLARCKERSLRRIGYRERDIRSRGYPVPRNRDELIEMYKKLGTASLQAEVRVAQARLDAARAHLESTELLLCELTVRAPANAVVGGRFTEVGEQVRAHTKLFTLFKDSTVFAVFPVPEETAVQLSQGMQAAVEVPALDGAVRRGPIVLLSPTADAGSGNFTVKVSLDNPQRRLKPGMFVRSSIRYGQSRTVTTVPTTAIINREGITGTVFTVVAQKAIAHRIEVGEEREGWSEIRDGISPGDLVIREPSSFLREGQHVEIMD